MATPLSADRLLKALRDEGLRVVEHRDWRSNNRNHKGPWGPVNGVMIHHTVTSGTSNSVELCYNGHSALPGPLCHGVVAKDGTVYLVGNGRANHAGNGDPDVLRAVINEQPVPGDDEATTDGNRHFYGFECINLGDGKDPWPAAQMEAIERASAAICRAHGWGWRSVIRHLDWQPGKVDPRGVDWPAMQARIAARLGDAPTPSTPSEEDDMPTAEDVADEFIKKLKANPVVLYDAVMRTDRATPPEGKATKENPTWAAESILREAATRAALAETVALRVEQKVAQLEQHQLTSDQIAAIATAVAQHPALAEAIADNLAARLKD